MNKKGNQRYQEVQNRIDHVFLQLLEEKKGGQITVSEICARAGIHRTTFYGHYTDVYELMEQLTGRMYKQVMEFFNEDKGDPETNGFLRMFTLIRERQEFFRFLLIESSAKGEFGISILPPELKEKVECNGKKIGCETDRELYYHQIFFCEGLTAVIRRWLMGGCEETPQEMRKIVERESMG